MTHQKLEEKPSFISNIISFFGNALDNTFDITKPDFSEEDEFPIDIWETRFSYHIPKPSSIPYEIHIIRYANEGSWQADPQGEKRRLYEWFLEWPVERRFYYCYNFISCLYSTVLNIGKLCVLYPLLVIGRIFQKIEQYAKKSQDHQPALWQRLISIPFWLVSRVCYSAHWLLEPLFSPLRFLSWAVDWTRYITYTLSMVALRTARFFFKMTYDYLIAQPSPLSKGFAVIAGLCCLPFYFAELAIRAVLYPFQDIQKACPELGIENTGQEWRNVSEDLFGKNSEKMHTVMEQIGQGIEFLFSVAGWTAISYFVLPVVASWVGLTNSLSALAARFSLTTLPLNPAGAAAGVIGGVSTTVVGGTIAISRSIEEKEKPRMKRTENVAHKDKELENPNDKNTDNVDVDPVLEDTLQPHDSSLNRAGFFKHNDDQQPTKSSTSTEKHSISPS